jgi:hypothetical protein
MLGDPARYGFCVTPSQTAIESRNVYFQRICWSMTEAVSAYVENLKVRNQILQRCEQNPNMDLCKKAMGGGS